MMISRRLLTTTALLAPVGLVLAACSGKPPTPSQVAQDVALIATGIGAMLVVMQGIPSIPADKLARVKVLVGQLQNLATQIAATTTGADTSTVQGIAALVTQIAAAVLPLFPHGGPVVIAVEAALVLVPVILAATGTSSVVDAPPKFTREQARAVLQAGT